MTTAEPPPSPLRFAVVGVTALAAVLLYLDRVCISISAVYRFGARRMLTIYILAWSLFTALTGLATGLLTLLAVRLAFGLAQAGAYPAAAGLVAQWMPLRERGLASGIVSLGGRIGGATAPLLTALLLVAYTPVNVSSHLERGDLDETLLHVSYELSRFGNFWESGEPSPLDARILDRLPEPGQLGQGDQLIANLNHVIAQPDLTDGLDLSDLNLSREALRLLAIPPADRTQAESERLNRLVLEASFPNALRQIYGRSWREVLITYGAVGLLVALAFWLIVRDRPVTSAKPASGIPWLLLARNRNMTLSSVVQFGVNIGWVFLITLLPDFLSEVYHVPIEERGTMQMVPLLSGCVGMFLGGPLTDQFTARIGKRWGRAGPITAVQFVCAVACLCCPWLPGAWSVVIALSVMAFAVDLGVPSLWAFSQDVGGRNVGAALGWGNMWGNLGAAVSPVLLRQVQSAGGWTAAFITCAVAFMVACTAAAFIDATKPIDPNADGAAPSPTAAG